MATVLLIAALLAVSTLRALNPVCCMEAVQSAAASETPCCCDEERSSRSSLASIDTPEQHFGIKECCLSRMMNAKASSPLVRTDGAEVPRVEPEEGFAALSEREIRRPSAAPCRSAVLPPSPIRLHLTHEVFLC